MKKVMSANPRVLALVDAAQGAQLLVVGSDHRGEHLGSAASYAVHHAPCPVVVYREPETGR